MEEQDWPSGGGGLAYWRRRTGLVEEDCHSILPVPDPCQSLLPPSDQADLESETHPDQVRPSSDTGSLYVSSLPTHPNRPSNTRHKDFRF